MDPKKNYYKILGVSENAGEEEIKQAYRRLAKEYHPDRRGGDKAAEERFKEISEAYSVLSDPQRRQEYDMLRKNPFMGQGGFSFGGQRPGGYRVHFQNSGFDHLGDLLGNLFGFDGRSRGRKMEDVFNSRFDLEDLFGPTHTHVGRGSDVETRITIPFELAANGGETVITTGAGRKVKIKIPPGIENGKRIRIRGHGAPAPGGGPPGDLYVRITVAPHPEFERKGKDIYSNAYINIAQAILGTEIEVRTIDGKKIKLKIPPGTSGGKVFRLPGMGVPGDTGRGDHYVRIHITVPDNLTPRQLKEFKEWARKVGLING